MLMTSRRPNTRVRPSERSARIQPHTNPLTSCNTSSGKIPIGVSGGLLDLLLRVVHLRLVRHFLFRNVLLHDDLSLLDPLDVLVVEHLMILGPEHFVALREIETRLGLEPLERLDEARVVLAGLPTAP